MWFYANWTELISARAEMGARAGGKVWPYRPSRRMGKEQEILLQTCIPLSHQVELLPQEGKTLKLESRKN